MLSGVEWPLAPSGPVDIPGEAFTALQALNGAIADAIPQRLEFALGMKQVDGGYQDDRALIVLTPEKLPRDRMSSGQLIIDIKTRSLTLGWRTCLKVGRCRA